jgi:hypothetical protein
VEKRAGCETRRRRVRRAVDEGERVDGIAHLTATQVFRFLFALSSIIFALFSPTSVSAA